ncbi:HAD-IIIA family hydrolase, partial [bacterium]|nr:HAD-IIIA family hydrolase [bacterium]
IDKVYVCVHNDGDNCDCRKPKPGMLLQAAQEWNIDLAGSYMVGDRWKDIEAGERAGCTTILVRSPFSEEQPEGRIVRSAFSAASLLEASEIILSREGDAK